MPSRILKSLGTLELEEKILNSAATVALISVFFPWLSGEWLGADSTTYTGFGFFTSFLGLCIFLLLAFTVAMAISPAVGGPVIIRKRSRDLVRLCVVSQATVLVLAVLSVLTRITLEFSRLQVRFGIYVTLVCCLVTLLYAFLRYQEHRRELTQAIFHHPEDRALPPEKEEHPATPPPPPPPPPPAPAAEEHRLYP